MFRRAKHADAGEQLLSGDRRRRSGATGPDIPGGDVHNPFAGPAAAAPGTTGPWDAADLSTEARAALLDVGSLLLPVADGMEVRLQVDEATQEVLGVLAVFGDSAVEVRAFAAPRSDGLWDEVRQEVAAETTKHGGVSSAVDGPFGTELRLAVSARDEAGRPVNQMQRMWGVDGPRWLLRASVVGAAAADDRSDISHLEEFVRGIAVARGKSPMAPREALPLTMPAGMTDPSAEAAGADAAGEP